MRVSRFGLVVNVLIQCVLYFCFVIFILFCLDQLKSHSVIYDVKVIWVGNGGTYSVSSFFVCIAANFPDYWKVGGGVVVGCGVRLHGGAGGGGGGGGRRRERDCEMGFEEVLQFGLEKSPVQEQ